MKMRNIFTMVLGLGIVALSGIAFAGVIDWSTSDVEPVDADTIRVFGLALTGDTSGTTYNVDFLFNESTLNFEPVLPSSAVVNNEANLTTADAVRGGLLYDKWWAVNGQTEPTANHPLYPAAGQKSGSTTWRCKECHGWDYKGTDGAYGSGSHFTGIKGVYEARNLNTAQVFAIIKSGGAIGSDHAFSSVLSDQDIWDLTRFIKESLIEMDKYIIFTGASAKTATGNTTTGQTLYEGTGQCGNSICHGADGQTILFEDGTEALGDLSNGNPWETLHKIRFGNPGSVMPSGIKNGLSTQDQVDILSYEQTLPKLAQ